MSHFTMLVPASDREHLESLLLPYHEYECTGIEAYTEWVDETDEYVEEYNEKPAEFVRLADGTLVSGDDDRFYTEVENDKGQTEQKWSLPDEAELVTMTRAEAGIRTFGEFVKDWSGGSGIPGEPGRYGRRTNANARWDWWLVGGRWDGLLMLKDGRDGQFGEPGVFGGQHRGEPGQASTALAGDVDWDGMRQEQLDQTIEKHRAFHKALAEIDEAELTAGSTAYDEDGARGDNARAAFSCERDYCRAILADRKTGSWRSTFKELSELYYLSEEQYKDQFRHKALTFGFMDTEGGWNERGNMGWWGMVNEEEGIPDYDDAFWRFVASLPPAQRVWVIDCHI